MTVSGFQGGAWQESGSSLAGSHVRMHKLPVFPNLPVLLVDGNSYSRRIVKGMLELAGIKHVIDAPDGGDALQKLTQFKPGLIILDWDAPMLSAYDLLTILRDPDASTETAVPVIVMAVAPTRRVVEQAAEHGIHHLLRKPFAPKALWQRIAVFYESLDPVVDVSPQVDTPLLPDPDRTARSSFLSVGRPQ